MSFVLLQFYLKTMKIDISAKRLIARRSSNQSHGATKEIEFVSARLINRKLFSHSCRKNKKRDKIVQVYIKLATAYLKPTTR